MPNFYWGVWALCMLADEDVLRTDVFNYDFAKARVEMFNLVNEKM